MFIRRKSSKLQTCILSSKGSLLLFHHFSEEGRRHIDRVDYASHKTADEVSRAIVDRSVRGGVQLFKEASIHFQHHSIPGYLFENLAHRGLESGKSFVSKRLLANSTVDDDDFKLENHIRSAFDVFENLEEVDDHVYYVPLEERFPSIAKTNQVHKLKQNFFEKNCDSVEN